MELKIIIPIDLEEDLRETFANRIDYDNEDKIEFAKNKIIEFVRAEMKSYKFPLQTVEERTTYSDDVDTNITIEEIVV